MEGFNKSDNNDLNLNQNIDSQNNLENKKETKEKKETGKTENSKIFSDVFDSIKDKIIKEKYLTLFETTENSKKQILINIIKNIPQEELEEYLDEELESDLEDNLNTFFKSFTKKYGENNTIDSNSNKVIEEKEKLSDGDILIKNALIDLDKYDTNTKIEIIKSGINTLNNIKPENEELKKDLEDTLNKLIKLSTLDTETNTLDTETNTLDTETNTLDTETNTLDNKATEAHQFLQKNLSKFKNISPEFNGKIEEIENLYKKGDLESLKKVNKILTDFFSDKKRSDGFLNKLEKEKPELYKETLQNFSNISPELEILFQKRLQTINSNKGKLLSAEIVNSETDSVTVMLPEGKVEKRGNVYSSGDKYIDFGEKPPISYIQTENGFRLKTKFTLPDTMEIRADLQRANLEFEPKIEQSKEKISQLENDITNIQINQEQLKNRLKILEILPENGSELEIVEIKKSIEKNEIMLESKKMQLTLEQDTLKRFEVKLKEAEDKYNKDMHEKLLNSGNTIRERDDEVRNRLKFLEATGFTMFPESITNLIFDFIKRHKGIINLNMGGKTINGRIDINNGVFGGDKITGKDSDKNKEIFITLLNKIISGNPDEPVDALSVVSGKKANSFADKATLVETLKKNGIMNDMGAFNINKIEEHLLNIDNKKEKETK